MKRKVIIALVIIIGLCVISCVSVFWAQSKLTNALPRIMSMKQGEIEIINDNIVAFGPAEGCEYRAIMKMNLLFPFGSWGVSIDGKVVWVTLADIKRQKVLK